MLYIFIVYVSVFILCWTKLFSFIVYVFNSVSYLTLLIYVILSYVCNVSFHEEKKLQ